jgi:hypothetical protein
MWFNMKEMTDNVRAGRGSNGSLNVEVWQVPRGWQAGSALGPMECITIPSDAVDGIFQYLR